MFLPNLWVKVVGLFNDNIESSKLESSELVVRPKICNNLVQLCYSVKESGESLLCRNFETLFCGWEPPKKLHYRIWSHSAEFWFCLYYAQENMKKMAKKKF